MTDGPSLLDTALGFAPAQIIHVAARLGLADHLADGPKTSADLATATGTHTPSLHRLLRALVGPLGDYVVMVGTRSSTE